MFDVPPSVLLFAFAAFLLAGFVKGFIGMGLPAVPLILEELQRDPDQWFWALEAITEENPIQPEASGKVRLMAQAWIDWGRRHGILTP